MQSYANTASRAAIIHRTRLATGLVLPACVSTHLLNHSCGLFGSLPLSTNAWARMSRRIIFEARR